MLHSPRVTRGATAAQEKEKEAGSTVAPTLIQEATTETPALIAAMRELRQLQEEREQERQELQELRRQQRQRTEERGQGESEERRERAGQSLALKLRPDVFDGSESFDQYIVQFELIARANAWSEGEKSLVFAANLRGKARTILEGIVENITYKELKSKLELRFGERFQNHYVQFINRKMKFEEDFASYGFELEKLVRFAYPECETLVREKIVCAQFIAGLPEGIIKRTLQLEGVVSLRAAVERARIIQEITRGESLSCEIKEKEKFYEKQTGFKKRETEFFERKQKNMQRGQGGSRNFYGKAGVTNQWGNFKKEC